MVEQFMLTIDDTIYSVEIKGNEIVVNGYPLAVEWEGDNLKVEGTAHEVELVGDQALVDGIAYSFAVEWPMDDLGSETAADGGAPADIETSEGTVKAIMPGKVVRITVQEGDEVQKSQMVAVLEAMKMENELNAPISGVVKQIFVSPGDNVKQDQPILDIE
jgi:biotin carboxyl carrier protein